MSFRRPSKWTVLTLMLLVQVAVSLLQQAPAALGPVLTHDLGLSRVEIGALFASTYGGMVLATLPAGIVIDRIGERQLALFGVTTMGLLALEATRAGSFPALFVPLFLAGVAGATGAPGGTRAVSGWFPRHQWGMALGVRQVGVTLGGFVAAVALPPVAARLGWSAGLGMVAAVVLLIMLSFGVFYPRREMRTEMPVARPSVGSLLRNRQLLVIAFFSFVMSGAQACAMSYLALFAHQSLRYTIGAAGLALGALYLGGMTGRAGWGIVSDRRRRPATVLLGVAVFAIGACAAMAALRAGTWPPIVFVLAFVLGCSIAGWNGLVFTAVSHIAGPSAAATAIGTTLTLTFLGPFFLPPLFGLLIDTTGSYTVGWLALSLWTAIGALLAVRILVDEGARLRGAALPRDERAV